MREHKTDGTPCWCNPKIIKVEPTQMDKIKCFKQHNEDGVLSGADKDDRFCNSHNDNSSFIEVIECNECNFYLK